MAKARKAKLKVFRTPIGFHDAYVAAPSQKAALEAWGSDSNLFAAGTAELVTDAGLAKEPLARPGEVVRRLRGTADEQVEALDAGNKGKKEARSRTKRARQGGASTETRSGATKKGGGRGERKRGKRPSSAAVDKAEQAVARADERHRQELSRLKAEAAALDKRRRELERRQRSERQRLRAALDQVREKYRSAMEQWAR